MDVFFSRYLSLSGSEESDSRQTGSGWEEPAALQASEALELLTLCLQGDITCLSGLGLSHPSFLSWSLKSVWGEVLATFPHFLSCFGLWISGFTWGKKLKRLATAGSCFETLAEGMMGKYMTWAQHPGQYRRQNSEGCEHWRWCSPRHSKKSGKDSGSSLCLTRPSLTEVKMPEKGSSL